MDDSRRPSSQVRPSSIMLSEQSPPSSPRRQGQEQQQQQQQQHIQQNRHQPPSPILENGPSNDNNATTSTTVTPLDPVNAAALLSAALIYNKKSLKDGFAAFDRDGKGTIKLEDFVELSSLLFQGQLSTPEIRALFDYINIRKDGFIHWDEWHTCLSTVGSHSQQLFSVAMLLAVLAYNNLSLEQGFEVMNKSQCNKGISMEDFCDVAGELLKNQLLHEQVQQLHAFLDEDRDGFIAKTEWISQLQLVASAPTATGGMPPSNDDNDGTTSPVLNAIASEIGAELSHNHNENQNENDDDHNNNHNNNNNNNNSSLNDDPFAGRRATSPGLDNQQQLEGGKELIVVMQRLRKVEMESAQWKSIATDQSRHFAELTSDYEKKIKQLTTELEQKQQEWDNLHEKMVTTLDNSSQELDQLKRDNERLVADNAKMAAKLETLQNESQAAKAQAGMREKDALDLLEKSKLQTEDLQLLLKEREAEIASLRNVKNEEAMLISQIRKNVAQLFDPKLRTEENARKLAQSQLQTLLISFCKEFCPKG